MQAFRRPHANVHGTSPAALAVVAIGEHAGFVDIFGKFCEVRQCGMRVKVGRREEDEGENKPREGGGGSKIGSRAESKLEQAEAAFNVRARQQQ